MPLWWWLLFVLDLALWTAGIGWVIYLDRKARGE